MKKIIAGQLMIWLNLASVVTAFFIYRSLDISSEYTNVLIGFLGVISSCFNLIIAILLQVQGYREKNIL